MVGGKAWLAFDAVEYKGIDRLVGGGRKLHKRRKRGAAHSDDARVPYSLCLLSPEKYNEVQPSNNMNRIKARLHNMCYRNLKKKYGPLPGKIVIDQFTPEHLYYRYLEGEPEIIRGITFETKAEDKYLSVGAASMIARFAFLQAMDRMSETYGTEFPKGAGTAVDEFAADFVKKYGKDELRKTAKLNFANTKKLPE